MTYDHPIPSDAEPPCREDPELFFPVASRPGELRAAVERAKAVCRTCPLVDPCLAWALRYSVEGIWGNTTKEERNKFRDDNGLVAIPVVSSPYTMRAYQLRVDGAA